MPDGAMEPQGPDRTSAKQFTPADPYGDDPPPSMITDSTAKNQTNHLGTCMNGQGMNYLANPRLASFEFILRMAG